MLSRNYIVVFLVLISALSFSSCQKWVNVEPQLQVDQNELFASEQGFRDALNGVYLQMGSQSLYGRDLTTGVLSIMGRSYDTSFKQTDVLFYQSAAYNVGHYSVKNTFANAWDSLYLCVANLNNVLANVDSRQNVFSAGNYNTIKGEALGLRAFIHFDLLRLFAPSPAASGLSAPAIPYVTKISPYASPVLSTGAVIDSCISDLLTAQSLLSSSDMTTSRFTIWAVKGLLARIYMYKGDLANAQSSALAVINSNMFPLATNNTDLMFTKEQLFLLYSSSNIALAYNKSVFVKPLGLSPTSQNSLFVTGGGSGNDYRKLGAFVDPASGTAIGNTISPKKFYTNGSVSVNALPMIRLTELYYIAAEASNAAADSLTATNLLDTVRVHRNLPKYTQTALKRDSINIEIGKEYQKEFLGEGQVFFYYKRKNIPFSSLPYTKVPVVSNASYVFIKPE
ncbi:RagB/SusD family nutrient uptake outer membrane protein [Pinibacter aurantiacus]|uniref:RagB/SusD family nutrient uptake outer membrane protein n=1 Tax=Pinibacter aurantiacus TaxID=2851599 RepID=A0A9E2SDY7_9BACT|nr:RagB/SusD family nutrient uptake outer membrane protein [Pinibacter aurantiacus]MBV4359264.1 RagB/SusD family nutrient uptake outer membrane protein [Pinibacter aurantiacus]